MVGSKWVRIGAISGALGVSVGALGAHAVKTSLETKAQAGEIAEEIVTRTLANWATATEYMMYHSIAIILVGLVSAYVCSRLLTYAGSFFTAGIVGFSLGLLAYHLILLSSGTKVILLVAAVVPLGGICFILGWCCLAAALWTCKSCNANSESC